MNFTQFLSTLVEMRTLGWNYTLESYSSASNQQHIRVWLRLKGLPYPMLLQEAVSRFTTRGKESTCEYEDEEVGWEEIELIVNRIEITEFETSKLQEARQGIIRAFAISEGQIEELKTHPTVTGVRAPFHDFPPRP